MLTLSLDMDALGLTGKRVLCAVSGGADSVALLRLLCDLRNEGVLELYAAHFEHGIRGKASVQDLHFVKELCAALNVPLTAKRADVPKAARRSHEGIESCARRLRHEFLEETRRKLCCDVIALAHHRRDRAETVLMHLLRGSGLRGAAAMPVKTGNIVRPLIDVDPDEIRRWLTEIGQEWREDETNAQPDNPRNALRLDVFPRLRQIYPGFEAALNRFAEISGEEDRLLEALTDEYEKSALSGFAGVWVLKKGEPALTRRCVHRLMPEGDFDMVEKALTATKARDLGQGFIASGDMQNVYLCPAHKKRPKSETLRLSGTTVLKGVCRVTARDCPAVPIKNNGYTQVLNKEALAAARLRLWQKNDFICPLGLKGGRKTLGDYFTDRHFPPALRHHLPIVAKDNEALWVPGLGISEKLRVMPENDAVELTIEIMGGNDDD